MKENSKPANKIPSGYAAPAVHKEGNVGYRKKGKRTYELILTALTA